MMFDPVTASLARGVVESWDDHLGKAPLGATPQGIWAFAPKGGAQALEPNDPPRILHIIFFSFASQETRTEIHLQ